MDIKPETIQEIDDNMNKYIYEGLEDNIELMDRLGHDDRTSHISTIPGIIGKGDLSTKPHPRALNPDFNLEIAKVFRFGQLKHGENNFRTMTHEASGEIWDALQRHLLAYNIGETYAKDSNLHHLAHAAANLHMLFRLIKRHGDDKVLEVISGGDIK